MSDCFHVRVSEAVERGALYLVGHCRCMTDETSPPREECDRCHGTGLSAAKVTGVSEPERTE